MQDLPILLSEHEAEFGFNELPCSFWHFRKFSTRGNWAGCLMKMAISIHFGICITFWSYKANLHIDQKVYITFHNQTFDSRWGFASAISSDEGLSIGGRGVLDELEGSHKQDKSDCIIEIELGFYKINLKVVLRRLLLALYIGGSVPKSWSDTIQVRCRFTI
jgi:hypothetical protein